MANYKVGANPSDKIEIRKLAEQDYTADEIASMLRLPKSCVESFMPVKEQPKPKRKAAAKPAPAEKDGD